MASNSINLYFSHSVEQLAQVLADQVMLQQASGSIFVAPKVLVPNANMQRYLQLTMAKINGVCAHVDFPFLETGLFQAVNELLDKQFTHLSGTMVAWSVWRLLHDEKLLENPVYASIKTYLGGIESAQLLATKRWQLSQKLAKLMLDYEAQRPEMVHQWLQGKQVFHSSSDTRLKQSEQLQKDLYLRIYNAEFSQRSITLFQAALKLERQQYNSTQQSIHIFTPSRLSQLHRKLLLQLGQFMSIHIYSLNVCSEYWEDLQTEQEVRWQQRLLKSYKSHPVSTVDNDGLPTADTVTGEVFVELSSFADENELLKAWGKPGREALKLFSEIEVDAIHHSIAYQDDWLIPDFSAAHSLLHVLQSNVLNRSAAAAQIQAKDALSSLQFACAPSIIREVEAVYNSILWNLEQSPELALNEIAVLVTDMNQYRFVLEQVFEELNHQHQLQLSYAIVDSSAAKESLYAAAVLDLFTVLDEDFIRSSVFKWLDNPCVQAANHFDANDWQDWLSVVDQLGIYCGFSALYPASQDDYNVAVDQLFTWQQGLSRLHQSLATGSDNGAEFDVSAIGAERIGQLSVLLETLYQYKLRLNQVQTAAQWEQQLNQLFDLLIAVPADNQQEHNIQMALQQSLLNLAAAEPDLRLSFADIKQFISHELQQLPASKGSYLSGGVVCAALQPMRPIPFKLTYVLGLDEKTFPGQVRHETLDLTQRSRRIGDINTVENNNYLLLETLMCSREKLYLSYVGMDLLRDEIIQPSPAFSTLYQYATSLLDLNALDLDCLPITQLPLDASESAHFDGSQLELQDWGVNYSFADYLLKVNRQQADWQPRSNDLSPAQLSAWQRLQAVKSQEQADIDKVLNLKQMVDTNSSSASVIQLDAQQLADYLSNPQAAVLQQLGIESKHPEDRSLVEHEPTQLTPLLKHAIFTDSIKQWLEQPQTANLPTIIKQQHQHHLSLSQAPLALFADLAELAKVAEPLNKALVDQLADKQVLGSLKVGQASTQATADLAVDGVLLTLDNGQQVQINGLAEQLYQQAGYLSDQVVISSSKQSGEWNKKLIKPFINWCLWQLSNQVNVAEVFNVHLVFPDKYQHIEFKQWYAAGASFATKPGIESYLQKLVQQYLALPAYFLPSDLLNDLKVTTKPEVPQAVPFLGKGSKAKSNHYLAYEHTDLCSEDVQAVLTKYMSGMHWPSYEEIFQLVQVQPSDDPLTTYRQNLMPLFAMVKGRLDVVEQGGQS